MANIIQTILVFLLLSLPHLSDVTPVEAANGHPANTHLLSTEDIQAAGPDLLTLLHGHRYSELDRRINMLQSNYERNTDKEAEVKKAVGSLSVADPDLEGLFQEWLQLYPDSYAANLSAGSYYLSMAIEWRGNKYFNETHPRRIEKMDQYLERAKAQLEKSLQFSGKPIISYSKLIAIARNLGDNEAINRWFAEAVKHDPFCVAPRIAYMRTLEPRWGGSLRAMDEFAKETHKTGNPKTEYIAKMLDGWIYWYNGYQHYLNGRYVDALADFNKAIALDPTNQGSFITDRAEIYKIVGQTDLAMADVNLQLQSDPLSARALLLRGEILLVKRQPAEALNDIRRAAELYDIAAMSELGDLYTRGNSGVPIDMEEGVKWLKRAAYFMDEYSCYNLGGMSERGIGMPVDHVSAVKYYRAAAEQGYGLAINDLGMMLWYGRGTPADRDEAVQLWVKGAEKDVWQSKHNLQFFLSTPELLKVALHYPRLFIEDKRLMIVGICLILILLLTFGRLIVLNRPDPNQSEKVGNNKKVILPRKLLPYDAFEIQTALMLEDAVSALKKEVEPKKWLRVFRRDHAIFEGHVLRDGFKITRIMDYKNSFAPVIRGTFKQSPNGLRVLIRMNLHPLVVALLCVWFGFVMRGLLAQNFSLFVPLVLMFILAFAMILSGFRIEVRNAKPKLISILKGQIKRDQIDEPD